MQEICVLKYYAFILFILSINPGFGQADTIKEGAYLNSTEFAKNSPIFEYKFEFKRKKNSNIPELYQIVFINPETEIYDDIYYNPENVYYNNKIKKLTEFAWGIYSKGYFYINARKLGMVNGYIKILNFGKYCYFKGRPVKSIGQKEIIKHSCCMFGLVGGFIATAIVSKKNKGRDHYILNIETGMVNVLTKSYMLRILEPFPDLYFSYNREEDQDSPPIQIEYINKVNEGIENQHNF